MKKKIYMKKWTFIFKKTLFKLNLWRKCTVKFYYIEVLVSAEEWQTIQKLQLQLHEHFKLITIVILSNWYRMKG